MFQFKSISTKFIAFVSLLIFLSVGLFVVIIIYLSRQSRSKVKETNEALMADALREEWEEKGRAIASLLAIQFVQPMYELDVSRMHYLASLTLKEKGFGYIYVQDDKGRVLVDATGGAELMGGVLLDEITKKAFAAEGVLVQKLSNSLVDIAAPIMAGTKRLGIVRIGLSTENIQKTTAIMTDKVGDSVDQVREITLRKVVFLLPVTVLPAMIVGWILVHGLTMPIRELVVGTERIARGDLTFRIKTKSRDEIGQLTASFNKMTEDLQKTTVSKDYVDNIIESMADTLIVATPKAAIQSVNRATCDLLGYREDELIGKPITVIFGKDGQQPKETRFDDLVEKGSIRSVETNYLTRDGRKIPMLFSGVVMRGDDGEVQGIVCVAKDITERKRTEEAIQQMAYYDSLTDLPNRKLFNDRLTLELAHARRNKQMLAVLFLDMDRFKDVNDTLGHTVGDQLLKTIATGLENCVREDDTVSRLGGDEVPALLPGIKCAEDAVKIAHKILKSVKQPMTLAGHQICTATSIGIALYPEYGEDAETLLKHADIAMYHAKEQGRDNCQLYTPELRARASKRLTLENGLRSALERKEFIVHYQPQVNVGTGQIIGTEALVRWQHCERGLVYPGEFVSLAEDVGLILPIGEWVLHTACVQNKIWKDAGLPSIRVSVNLSARQFQQEDMVEKILHALKETGLEPHLLELEITEGTAMRNVETTVAKLNSLKRLGVQIAIDDLGTGYSSLSYLKKFPIDSLKIDRSFVGEVTTDPNDGAIVTAIIAMAKGLNLRVVAEGVETEEQLAFLKERQCDEAQGYLFGKPAPAEEFKNILASDKFLLPPLE